MGGWCSGCRVRAGLSLYSSSSTMFATVRDSSSIDGMTVTMSSIYILAQCRIIVRAGSGIRGSWNLLSRCLAAPSIARGGADAHPWISRIDSTIHPPMARNRGRVPITFSRKSNGTAMYASSPRAYGYFALSTCVRPVVCSRGSMTVLHFRHTRPGINGITTRRNHFTPSSASSLVQCQ